MYTSVWGSTGTCRIKRMRAGEYNLAIAGGRCSVVWLADCKPGADAHARVFAAEDVGDYDDTVLFLCCIVADGYRLWPILLLHSSPPVEPQPSRSSRSRFVFDRQVFDDVSLSIALLPS
jgi:hypothetical protein